MKVYVGTSGYSYKEWKGTFYPEKIAAKQMLAYYAERLTTVEINNSFYRIPKEHVVEGWASEVPESFRFVLKASMRITHHKRLLETADTTEYMLSQFGAMGEKLGAILVQLPPNMKQNLDRLRSFLDVLPDGTRAAFEFRNASWFEEPTYECLRAKNCALVVSDMGGDEEPPFVATADWGYLRLRREDYGAADLDRWAERIRAQSWGDVFVFFKHEDAGAGPRMAGEFLWRFDGSDESR